ncbi:hypothetical protein V6N13_032866 [Hibiscus sabdariffa]|uniref:Cytochrome P450 n=1 Tax=Hibiscus sabdariffa TaxID=183260 RepID=A0ABR2FBX8_9ROSI
MPWNIIGTNKHLSEKVMAVDMVVAFLLVVLCLILGHWYRNRNSRVRIWPVVGMLPALASNVDRMLDFFTDVLKSSGGTFEIRGPWFAGSDFLVTAHPMNINHILCKNHGNYVKGPELKQILEPYEGIITSDSHVWKMQKKALLSFFMYNKKSTAYMDRISGKCSRKDSSRSSSTFGDLELK